MIVNEYYKRSSSKMTPDSNHFWLSAVNGVSQEKLHGRATIQKTLVSNINTQRWIICVRGTKPGTLSNGLMGEWFYESSLSYSLSTSGESQWMISIQPTVKHWGESSSPVTGLYGQSYQPIWGHCTGRRPTYTWLNTIYSGFGTQEYSFSNHQIQGLLLSDILEKNISMSWKKEELDDILPHNPSL